MPVAIELSPEARPSMPSIRFMALMMNTITIAVNGMPIHDGMFSMPNDPASVVNQHPALIRSTAHTICTTNFARYFMPMRSSAIPTR